MVLFITTLSNSHVMVVCLHWPRHLHCKAVLAATQKPLKVRLATPLQLWLLWPRLPLWCGGEQPRRSRTQSNSAACHVVVGAWLEATQQHAMLYSVRGWNAKLVTQCLTCSPGLHDSPPQRPCARARCRIASRVALVAQNRLMISSRMTLSHKTTL